MSDMFSRASSTGSCVARRAERARLIPLASGTVLEVGIGSGLNLEFYGPGVTKVYALDPSLELWKLASRRGRGASVPVDFFAASGERIPLDDSTADTAVTTWKLCNIPHAGRALGEI